MAQNWSRVRTRFTAWRSKRKTPPAVEAQPIEQSFLESEANIRLLFECVADTALMVDRQARILEVNERTFENLGYTRDELLKLSLSDLDPHFAPAEYLDLWNQVVNKRFATTHRTLKRKDGTTFFAELRAGLFHSDLRPLLFVIIHEIAAPSLAQPFVETENAMMQLMHSVSAWLSSDRGIDHILDEILIGVQRLVPCDAVNVMLFEAGIGRVMRCRGYAERGSESVLLNLRLPLSEFTTLREINREGKPLIVEDTQTYAGWIDVPAMRWIRAHMSVPILANHQVIGVLALDSATPHRFNLAHAAQLSLFASQAAIALKDARLAADSQRRIRELSALINVISNINSTLELEWVLRLTMQEVQDLFQVERCSLLLLDEQTDELVFRAAGGSSIAEIDPQRLSVNQGIAGWVVRQGQPALVNDVHNDPRWFGSIDSNTGFQTRSILAVPLRAGGKVIGALEAINKARGEFTESDLRLLDSISLAVGQAIENARLFGELAKAYQDTAQTQNLILESRNTLRAVFDGITDSICIIDRQLNVRALNRTAATEAGGDLRTFIGQPCHELVCRSESACGNCLIKETLASGKPAAVMNSRLGLSGVKRELEEHTYPLENAEGVIDRVVYIARDVTEKRKMEAALIQSAKLSAVGQLAAGVAHEINNPMAAIIANAQMLLEGMNADDPNYQMAQLIERAGMRAGRVIRNLLDFSRQEEYNFAPTDLNATIEDALSLVGHQLERSRVSVVKNLSDDLPLITASASHLQTIWTNLMLNAQDALAHQADRRIEITTRLGEDGKTVQVIFADNGVGIPEKDQSRIFDPFFTTKPQGKGTGLGLAISYAIMTAHHGTIQVQSGEGAGATFSVTLPTEEENI